MVRAASHGEPVNGLVVMLHYPGGHLPLKDQQVPQEPLRSHGQEPPSEAIVPQKIFECFNHQVKTGKHQPSPSSSPTAPFPLPLPLPLSPYSSSLLLPHVLLQTSESYSILSRIPIQKPSHWPHAEARATKTKSQETLLVHISKGQASSCCSIKQEKKAPSTANHRLRSWMSPVPSPCKQLLHERNLSLPSSWPTCSHFQTIPSDFISTVLFRVHLG